MARPRTFHFGLLFVIASFTAAGCDSQAGNPPTASIAGSGSLWSGSSSAKAAGLPAPKPKPDKQHPVAQIHTTTGDIIVRLDADRAPISVDNFLEYVESGHYDNTLVHQVLEKPSVILAGGFDPFQNEKPSREPIRNEARNGLKNVRGTIGMARSPDSIDSSTCQFYINAADNPQLDPRSDEPAGYGYAVFGQVVAGMEVVDRIAQSAVRDTDHLKHTPVEQVIIRWIHVER
ncbi:MAG TPA: peptidylprolyl isomerase [Pirellulales bacterium]